MGSGIRSRTASSTAASIASLSTAGIENGRTRVLLPLRTSRASRVPIPIDDKSLFIASATRSGSTTSPERTEPAGVAT